MPELKSIKAESVTFLDALLVCQNKSIQAKSMTFPRDALLVCQNESIIAASEARFHAGTSTLKKAQKELSRDATARCRLSSVHPGRRSSPFS